MKKLCEQEADKMASYKFLYYAKNGTFVFSKDENGNYSWEKANLKDKFINFYNTIKGAF